MNSTTKSHMNIQTKWNVMKEHSEQHRLYIYINTQKAIYI